MSKRRPFGGARSEQSATGAASVNAAILKQARATGVLNLSNRSLSSVPDDVWKINIDAPAEAREAAFGDGERWWDQVELNKLILASNQLTRLSNDIKLLTGLVTLDVHDNSLDSLPTTIGELQKLQKLSAGHNKIQSLPNTMGELGSLVVLHVQHNALQALPQGILAKLIHLEDLDMSSNHISNLPDDMKNLARLTRLNIAENKLTCLPESLGSLSALKYLDVSHNGLIEVPGSLANLSALELLYLRHNRLSKFPMLSQCKSLKELHLGNNCLPDVPVGGLQPLANTLALLELRDNKLSVLPDEVVLLQQLQRLDLTNNNLSGLPCQMGKMSQLTAMQLDGNPLKALRRDIISKGTQEVKKYLLSRIATEEENPTVNAQALPSRVTEGATESRSAAPHLPAALDAGAVVDTHAAMVTKSINYSGQSPGHIPASVWEAAAKYEVLQLNIGRNQLTEFPLGLLQLSRHLRDLNLSFNKLTVIPQDIGSLVHLQNLDLRNNLLSSLPQELASLQSLREIAISANRFPDLPDVIYKLSALENLFADGNTIATINAAGIQKLQKLACLDLQNNNISNVPAELGLCTELRSLLLNGNPFRNPRPAILAKGTPALLEYLRGRIPQ